MFVIKIPDRSLAAVAGRTELSKKELLDTVVRLAREDINVQLIEAAKVFGKDHIESAFMKASRAFGKKENVADNILLETMLYLSGCRQIQEAIDGIGLKEDTRQIVCIAEGDEGLKGRLIDEFSIEEDDSLIADSASKDIGLFGIGEKERETVPDNKRTDLILEKVAAVDIMKR